MVMSDMGPMAAYYFARCSKSTSSYRPSPRQELAKTWDSVATKDLSSILSEIIAGAYF
jgi:hypothetical protein